MPGCSRFDYSTMQSINYLTTYGQILTRYYLGTYGSRIEREELDLSGLQKLGSEDVEVRGSPSNNGMRTEYFRWTW